MNVIDYKMVYYNPWDAQYLSYLVIDYNEQAYEKECKRLKEYKSTEYIGYYGVTGFSKYTLLAIYADKYQGFVYKGCYCPPYGFEYEDEEKDKVIERINLAAPDIIIAGMGTPKTEIFLMENYQRMDAKVTLSVGAAIDFFAGNVKRCPEWINKIGMEWFYRFLKEPKRMFRRYFINDPKFLKLFFQYKPKKNK